MVPVRIDQACARINDLRDRLRDINAVLAEALTASSEKDAKTRQSLLISIRALQAVSADLEAVCNEQLVEAEIGSDQRAADPRAKK